MSYDESIKHGNRALYASATAIALFSGAAGIALWPESKEDYFQKDVAKDVITALSTAQVAGMYAGLDELGVTLDENQAVTREDTDLRYQELRESEFKDYEYYKAMDHYYDSGADMARNGYVTAEEVSEYGEAVLWADASIQGYMARTEENLFFWGVPQDQAEKAVTALVVTEYFDRLSEKPSIETHIKNSELPEWMQSEVIDHLDELKDPIDKMEEKRAEVIGKFHMRQSVGEFGRVVEVGEPWSAWIDGDLAVETSLRPVARSEQEGSSDEEGRIARVERAKERALDVAQSRRPEERPKSVENRAFVHELAKSLAEGKKKGIQVARNDDQQEL